MHIISVFFMWCPPSQHSISFPPLGDTWEHVLILYLLNPLTTYRSFVFSPIWLPLHLQLPQTPDPPPPPPQPHFVSHVCWPGIYFCFFSSLSVSLPFSSSISILIFRFIYLPPTIPKQMATLSPGQKHWLWTTALCGPVFYVHARSNKLISGEKCAQIRQ